ALRISGSPRKSNDSGASLRERPRHPYFNDFVKDLILSVSSVLKLHQRGHHGNYKRLAQS
ncbi:hypothetical protein, partial [uncultured Rubinisphaera sp.]|uniref:hypothetical protein n=1 Tax=uncultured Rubinisphaera sp. TaxID=1678686 RepID=UPI0030DA3294